jgi:RNA 2',3'-cyclic 3'-phosphodiesterase
MSMPERTWSPSEHHLYFTVKPDPATGDRALRAAVPYARRFGLRAKPTRRELLHVTLNGLGAYVSPPDALVDRALAAAGEVRMAPFLVGLDCLESWSGARRPLVLTGEEGVIGLRLLHNALAAALARSGLGGRRKFVPHMTVMRDRREVAETAIEPLTWRVGEFLLVDSPYGEARHNVLGRWPLTA